jgi:SAM-dependent methyltransferase
VTLLGTSLILVTVAGRRLPRLQRLRDPVLQRAGCALSALRATIDRSAVWYEGAPLPPPDLRAGGPLYRDNGFFCSYADRDVALLREWFGVGQTTRLLDVGCGACRLAIGILRNLGSIRHYCGVDLDVRVIEWGRRYLTRRDPSFQFVALDVANERYRPEGSPIGEGFRFPFVDSAFDLIYMSGVAPHLVVEELAVYFREFRRLLVEGGGVYLTAFLEDGVPPMTINPPDYLGGLWSGPRNCVRYETSFFLSLLEESGFRIERYVHAGGVAGQSLIAARRS